MPWDWKPIATTSLRDQVEGWGMIAGLVFLFGVTSVALGQLAGQTSGESTGQPATRAAAAAPTTAPAIEIPKIVERRSFTDLERRKICNRYAGRYIAYYGDVFKVENCKRRPILNSKTVYGVLREGVEMENVAAEVIAALSEGEPLDYAMTESDARSCQELEGKYISYSNVDVFYIEKCQKRLLPDWTTYLDHRAQRGQQYGEILSVSWLELSRLKEGEPIPSITDREFAKSGVVVEAPNVDVIPIDEACKGINGKTVFYYSNIYRIENCRKRAIDPQEYFRNYSREDTQLQAMTSEQWISIPDGPQVARTEPPKDTEKEMEERDVSSPYHH
jgi:hypothetical protein